MKRDLFLAILSMDSYNRRYGQHLTGLADKGSIGNAVISTDSIDQDPLSAASGFYAIAYTACLQATKATAI
jgi:hypothetical protein